VSIELCAIVEELYHGETYKCADGVEESTVDVWHRLGTWEFGSNDALNEYLYDHTSRGWPCDSSALEDAAFKYCDEGRRWCYPSMLESALKHLKKEAVVPNSDGTVHEWLPRELEALLAAVRVMTGYGRSVRVLWYKT
jgi:hypothetical protein